MINGKQILSLAWSKLTNLPTTLLGYGISVSDTLFDTKYEALANKNTANGYVGLNGSTKIDATYLPSFVDDVLEYADFASLPLIGETGKIYLTLDGNKIFRWSGSVYVEVSAGAIPTIQAVLGTGNEVSTDTLIKNGNAIIQMKDSVTGVTNFFGQIGNGTNYGDATVKAGFNTRNTVENRMETIVPGATWYYKVEPGLLEIVSQTSSVKNAIKVLPNNIELYFDASNTEGYFRQDNSRFKVDSKTKLSNDQNYNFDIAPEGLTINTRINNNQKTFFQLTDRTYRVSCTTSVTDVLIRDASFTTSSIKDEIIASNTKASSIIKPTGNVWEQHEVINSTYSQITQNSNGLRYKKVENNITVQDIYLNEQTISALQFVDDSFTSLAVTGAIGSTGASVSFTTTLKNIPCVFVNGLRFKVGVNATPANNICFFGPDASTVRTSLSSIVSGDLLFWNPLFANSFDLATTDEIILNYTKS